MVNINMDSERERGHTIANLPCRRRRPHTKAERRMWMIVSIK